MDVEKTVQFIVEMQAKHEVAIQQHDEAIRQWDDRLARLREQTEERFRTLVDICSSLAHHAEETDRRFRELNEETNRRFQDTDYKLHALIDTVDKLVKRNGHQ